jgi:hypothetical protein
MKTIKKYTLKNDTFGLREDSDGMKPLGDFKKLERVAYALNRHEKWAKSAGRRPIYCVRDETGRDITKEIRAVIHILFG